MWFCSFWAVQLRYYYNELFIINLFHSFIHCLFSLYYHNHNIVVVFIVINGYLDSSSYPGLPSIWPGKVKRKKLVAVSTWPWPCWFTCIIKVIWWQKWNSKKAMNWSCRVKILVRITVNFNERRINSNYQIER